MRIGVYCHIGNKAGRAIVAGFEKLGHKAIIRTAKYWDGKTEKFDAVFVKGEHSGRAVSRAYQAIGVPVMVFDWGYFKRVNSPDEHAVGHWQVGPGGLNKIPSFECPSDRFDALGLEIVEQGGDPNGYVLICGQVPGDAALGQNSSTHRQWLRDQMAAYEDAVYRPHPRGGIAIPGLVGNNQPLADALAGARLVVTYTSNVGHDALLAGVPVVAHGPAAYAELSGEELPSVEARRAYFNRAAYGQWTVDEMASGEAQKVWLEELDAGAVLVNQHTGQARDARDVASDPGAVLAVDPGEPLLAVTENRPDDAHPGAQVDSQGLEPVATDYSSLKVPELRALLTERGVAIPAGTNKAGLLELLEQS